MLGGWAADTAQANVPVPVLGRVPVPDRRPSKRGPVVEGPAAQNPKRSSIFICGIHILLYRLLAILYTFLLTDKDAARAIRKRKQEIQQLERLRGSQVIVEGETLITLYHATQRTRRSHRKSWRHL